MQNDARFHDLSWRSKLCKAVGDETWATWFKHLEVFDTEKGPILIVSEQFAHDWIINNYGYYLRQFNIRLKLQESKKFASGKLKIQKSSLPVPQNCGKYAKYAKFDPEMSFDSFVVSSTNYVAFEVAKKFAENFENPPYTPFYINGQAGVGKTHILHAIGQEVTKFNRSVVYLSSDQFLQKFVKSIRIGDLEGFTEELTYCDVLLLDDFQFLVGKERTQEYFFKILNRAIESQKAVIISSDQLPAEFADLHDRMRSRLGSGMIATIHSPNYELRVSLLKKWDSMLEMDVLNLLSGLDLSIRELRGAFTRLTVQSECTKTPITCGFVESVLSDLMQSRSLAPSLDEIMSEVLAYGQRNMVKITKDRLRIAGRTAPVSQMRQIFMYLAHQFGGVTPATIGRYLNNRDRTTIRHGILKIKKQIAVDKYVSNIIREIRAKMGL